MFYPVTALSMWCPEHIPECQVDDYKFESMAHILNGCNEMKNNCSTRHGYIDDEIAAKVEPHCNAIYINKTVRCACPGTNGETNVLDLKPDILMKDNDGVNIIDIACPYDLYIDIVYQNKVERYQCIKEPLKQQGIKFTVCATIFGSLAAVHSQAVRGFIYQKMNKSVAKGLLKWCSTGSTM